MQDEALLNIIQSLLEQNKLLTEKLVGGGIPTEFPEPVPGPLHVSDEEADAKWRFDAGLIDKKELEDTLAELNFQGTEIELA